MNSTRRGRWEFPLVPRIDSRRIFLFLLLAALAAPAPAAVLRLEAFDHDGRPLSTRELLEYIAPAARKGRADPDRSGLYVTDLSGNPVGGRPWWVAGSTRPAIAWAGAVRVKLSLPWPVPGDGFSTVFLDKDAAGYSDGDSVNLNEEIALTQYRMFRDDVKDRMSTWTPAYKPSPAAEKLEAKAEAAMAKAHAGVRPAERARLFEEALPRISEAWAKVLFEHGRRVSEDPKLGPSLRWGLTLDESLVDRLADYPRILKRLEGSGATWVRLVFRLNPEDFAYENARSFNEYDRIVADLASRKIRIMASVLDSSLWPPDATARALRRRTRNLVLRYKDRIRAWEVASEPNGSCLGGCRSPVPDAVVLEAIRDAARQVKDIDASLETAATLYWWEGTAEDDRHPTFAWLKWAMGQGAFADIDVVGLSVYPEDNPLGMAFGPVFSALGQYFPAKRLMLGGFGYGEGDKVDGYWWLDPKDVDGARKDLLILYTGAACAVPRSIGGGFYWDALDRLLGAEGGAPGTLKIYRRTLRELGR